MYCDALFPCNPARACSEVLTRTFLNAESPYGLPKGPRKSLCISLFLHGFENTVQLQANTESPGGASADDAVRETPGVLNQPAVDWEFHKRACGLQSPGSIGVNAKP